jgi:hypothetical protein
MIRKFRTLATLAAVLCSVSVLGSDYQPVHPASVFHGMEMKLIFFNLSPGELYTLRISSAQNSTNGFTGSTRNAPLDGLTITPSEVSFKAPLLTDPNSKYSSARFSVGIDVAPSSFLSADVRKPATLKVDVRTFSHVFLKKEKVPLKIRQLEKRRQ